MKRILIIALLAMASLNAIAQKQELVINYIAHDHYNEQLLNALEQIYGVSSYNQMGSTYLYLANADKPKVIKCESRNHKEFEDFLYEINSQLKHNVWPEVDVNGLLDLLRKDDFIDDRGRLRYNYFTLNFYVSPSFFTYGYNETLIARLLWVLEISERDNVQVNIYHPENDGFTYPDEAHMFGPKGLNGNCKVMLYEF